MAYVPRDIEVIVPVPRGAAAQNCSQSTINGEDLRRAPIEHRKFKLSRLIRTPHPGIVLNDHYDGDGEIVFEHACKLTRQ
jgi:hypothetical protein